MRNIENYASLPEIQVVEVEKPREKYSSEELPEIEAKLVYDPYNLADHRGVCYIFSPSEKIKNLMLDGDGLISRRGRPFLKGKKVRPITAIDPEKVSEALGLATAPLTRQNKKDLTRYVNTNPKKPESGDSLLILFTLNTQTEKRLGMVSPTIKSIDYRRGQNGRV